MKRTIVFVASLLLIGSVCAQKAKTVKLPKPDFEIKNLTVVDALMQRHSVRSFQTKDITDAELSNLCWAACGISRDENHITAPSAMNSQEIILYVFNEKGAYRYNARDNSLVEVVRGDYRKLFVKNVNDNRRKSLKDVASMYRTTKDAKDEKIKSDEGQTWVKDAPVVLLMVADLDRIRGAAERSESFCYMDAGIVCENINLYCTAVGLATVPRASMDFPALRDLLKLSPMQFPVLNNPVGYEAEQNNNSQKK